MLETRKTEDGVVVVHMRDGENRVHADFVREWGAVLDKLESEPAPLALVTTGEGKFFSNGLDLAWLRDGGAADPGAFIADFCALLGRVVALPCATVAALNGHAFAAGGMFALAHDFRVMREDRGYFCLPEVDLGIPFGPGMLALIQQRLSTQTASEAILTGRRYGGPEAVARQIVHEAVAESEVLPRAIAMAQALAPKNPAVVRALKESMYRSLLQTLRGPQR